MNIKNVIKNIASQRNVKKVEAYKMIQDMGNGFYSWDGRLYKSDIVMACIRPRTKAVGKAVAKHVRETTENGRRIQINPEPYIRFLLEDPNPYMTGQMLQEKVENILSLNNNAFILIVRDEYGYPVEQYPISAAGVEALYKEQELYLKFSFRNGKQLTVPYTDIIHLRNDFIYNDIFGQSPAETLAELMECVTIIDQGIVKAVKNSGIIKWLLKFTNSLRPEDIKKNVSEFVKNYLSYETETFGAAGVDSKSDIVRIEPKDYVPNAMHTENIKKRIYAYFNTNEKIVMSNYSEDEWVSYYEAVVEPSLVQRAGEYTRKIFTRRERGFGNRIIYESSALTFASMTTKLNLVQFVDRGIMTRNEVRSYLNMAPIDGGDIAVLRKDTGILTEGDTENEESGSKGNNCKQ